MKKIYSFSLYIVDSNKENSDVRKDFDMVSNLAFSDKKRVGKVLAYKTFGGYREIITKKIIPVLYKYPSGKYSMTLNQPTFAYVDSSISSKPFNLATEDEINEYIVNNCDPENLENFNYKVDPKKLYLDKLNEIFKNGEENYQKVINKSRYSNRYIINAFLRFKKIVNKTGNLIYENYREIYSAKIASVNNDGRILESTSLEAVRKDYSIKENVPSMPYKINDEIVYLYKDNNDAYREIITDIEIPVLEIKSKGWGSSYKLDKDKTYYVFNVISDYWDHYGSSHLIFLPQEARLRVKSIVDFEKYLYEKFKLNQSIDNAELKNLYNEYLVKITYIINSSIEDYNEIVSKSDYSVGYEKVKIKEKADKLKKLYRI